MDIKSYIYAYSGNDFSEWVNRDKPRKSKRSEVTPTSLLLNTVNTISKDKNVLCGIKHHLDSLIHKVRNRGETQE